MRKKDIETIKEQIKKERKEKKKDLHPDSTFYNKLASTCLTKDIHIATLYKLCKVKHIDQMLSTMYETTIQEYNLHEPTVRRLLDDEVLKESLEKEITEKVRKVKLL